MKQVFLFILFLGFFACTAGAQKNEKKKNSPDEQVTVKREYDENGNLIRFDSLRVYKWSSDSGFQFPFDEGWEDFFGKDLFSSRPGHSLLNDSAFSFSFPFEPFPFGLPGQEDFLNDFGFSGDSALTKRFFFHNDTSLFIGPHSSQMLPPGFIVPDMEEMMKHFDKQFRSFSLPDFFGSPDELYPSRRFNDPKQQEEWEKMMKKHQLEMEQWQKQMEQQQKEKQEFMDKWDRKIPKKEYKKM